MLEKKRIENIGFRGSKVESVEALGQPARVSVAGSSCPVEEC